MSAIKVLTREPMLYFKDKVMERLRDDTVPIQKRIDDTEKVLTRLAEFLPDSETYKTEEIERRRRNKEIADVCKSLLDALSAYDPWEEEG